MNVLSKVITTALTSVLSPTIRFAEGAPRSLAVQANLAYGSGGTTVDAWLQTSIDEGATWIDIANFHFTTASARAVANLSAATPVTTIYTPDDGSLASNTVKDGILGSVFRVKLTTVGTYAASTKLSVDVQAGSLARLLN
jgi:hypothetical protein